MSRREDITIKIMDIFSYCKKSENIYIYGAGKYGKICYEFLKRHGQLAAGFITSLPEKKEYCGLPVYAVKDFEHIVTNEDGIISAFLNSKNVDMDKQISFAMPEIFIVDNRILQIMEYEVNIQPLIELTGNNKLQSSCEFKWNNWKNILVTRLDAIGDVVCTTAFIRELKKNNPSSNIVVVIRKQNEDLLKCFPYIDELVLYEGEKQDKGIAEVCLDLESLKEKVASFVGTKLNGICFDAAFACTEVLCGRNAVEEFLINYYSKATYRIGHVIDSDDFRTVIAYSFQDWYSKFLYICKPMHESEYLLEMLRSCGMQISNSQIEVNVSPDDIRTIEKKLGDCGIREEDSLIAVGIVGSSQNRNWAVDHYNTLFYDMEQVYGDTMKFLILGGNDAIESASKVYKTTNVINLTGELPLRLTMACIQKCELYIGSNTGLLHIAAALKKPAVTIYAELSDGSAWDSDGPVRYGAKDVKHVDLIPPAGLDGCHRVCTKNYSHCINQIKPFQVEQAIGNLMIN